MANMALTDANPTVAPRWRLRLPARVQALLSGEHLATQRMAGAAFAIRVAGAAVIFLSQVLLARWMGSSEFGTYVYAWTWLLLVGDIIPLGLPLTAQRYIPEYTQRNQFDRLRGFLLASRWLVFAIGTAAALLGALAVHRFARAFDVAAIVPLYFACIALPFYALANMLDGMARCYNAANIALLPQFVLRPIILIAVVGTAHAFGFMTDAATAMIAFAFATWVTTLFQLGMLQRRIAAAVPPGPRSYDIPQWIVTSLPIIAVWAFYTLLTYTDVLVLRHFRTAEEVAHYYAAVKTLALVAFIYYSVAAAVGHRYTSYHVAGDREGLAKFAHGTIQWTFWPSLAATALLLALGKPILWLFGPNFTAAYPLMFIMAIGLVARSTVGPAERLLNMLGQQRLCAMVYAIAFAINLSAAFVLAPRYGGLGAAIATALAILVETLLLFIVAKQQLGLHLFIWRPGRQG
jgi:O-antigen/teichoic acid export membrane protein